MPRAFSVNFLIGRVIRYVIVKFKRKHTWSSPGV